MELEQFRLHLEWIPGTRNLLADSLSRLLDVVPDAQKTREPEDHEFGSYCFEELETAKVMEKVSTEVIELTDNSEYQNDSQELRIILEKPGENESSIEEKKTQDFNSEFPEHSQNSRTESAVKIFEIQFDEKPMETRTLPSGSESQEDSQKSWMSQCVKIIEHENLKEIKLPWNRNNCNSYRRMILTAGMWQGRYIKTESCRKYSSKKKEFCTDSGLKMEERLSVS